MMPLIVAAAVITYLTRITGFYLRADRFSARFKQFLDDVPIAAFAALAAPGILAGGDETGPRTVAALVAAVFVWKFRKLWVCIVTGFAAYWLARLALGIA
jgi:branched-subunit amino acid transport protein